MASSQSAPAPPSLPPDIRDLILSHLVPPAPPLPPQALARTFIERLTFLPPSEDDLDAHLSPFPPTTRNSPDREDDIPLPNPLARALEQLVGGLSISDTQYTYDGEMTLARTLLSPQYGYGGDDEVVSAMFEHEDGDQGRGWVYRGAKLGSAGDNYRWVSHVENVSYEDAGDDYWAGFTPPTPTAQLPQVGAQAEDDYWAQYGQIEPPSESGAGAELQEQHNIGPETAATLGLLVQGLMNKGVDDDAETTATTKDAAHIANTDIVAAEPADSPTRAGSSSPRSQSPLEQKLRAQVRSLLIRAWTDFSCGQDIESCAYAWLAIGREVSERPSWGSDDAVLGGNVREAVVRARIDAASQIHKVLDDEKGSFWRLIEEAIRVHTSPVVGDESWADQEF